MAAGVDLGDLDGAAGADGGADQRRAAMAGDVEARPAAGLDVQVLGDTAGDVGSPAGIATRMRQRLAEMQHVDAVRAGELGERDHATEVLEALAWATVGQGPNRRSMARARRALSVSA